VNYVASTPGSSIQIESLSGAAQYRTRVATMGSGDHPRARVVWGSEAGVTKGERLQLRFTLLKGAKLYSYWIEDTDAKRQGRASDE
jgi:hypothetical protein